MKVSGESCPICNERDTAGIFSAVLPTNAGRLWHSAAGAAASGTAQVDLVSCDTCGFSHNRSFESSLVDYAADYDVSLVHSTTFSAFLESTAKRMVLEFDLRERILLELGCGRGDFLKLLCALGNNRGYGFDPSLSKEACDVVRNDNVALFPYEYSSHPDTINADFFCALGVLDCIPDPLGFLRDLRSAIGNRKPAVYFEVFNGLGALQKKSNWSIHYESCNYWSEASLTVAFQKAGFFVQKVGTCYEAQEYLFIKAIAGEPSADRLPRDISPAPALSDLDGHHEAVRSAWIERLEQINAAGGRVAVWGTGGKGSTFLSMMPAGLVDCVIDINPIRQGTYTPVSALRIDPPSKLAEVRPTFVVVTNPIYKQEIQAELSLLGVSCEIALL